MDDEAILRLMFNKGYDKILGHQNSIAVRSSSFFASVIVHFSKI